MIESLPSWIVIIFITTCLVTILLFHLSNDRPYKLTGLIVLWSTFHSVLAYNGFYLNTTVFPPRFGLILIPVVLLILASLVPKWQGWFLRTRNTKISTFIHIVRFPVEIVLLQLFLYKMIPELMTFEGRNFDIIMGITAPIVGYLWLINKIGRRVLLLWNVIGLILITFILINGILSVELPFQQFGFEQPNRAIAYFPFILLPATIVPLVIWTHVTDIIKLVKE